MFTLGLWIIPWIIIVATGGEKRYTIQKSATLGAARSTSQRAAVGPRAAQSRWVRHYLHECDDCNRDGPACVEGRDLSAAAR